MSCTLPRQKGRMNHPPAFPLSGNELEATITDALAEDIGTGDITSDHVIGRQARLHAAMVAREELVVCGLGIAIAIFRHLDPDVTVRDRQDDGTVADSGSPLVDLAGNARALLAGERTALNFVQHLSGIATLTRRYARTIAGTGAILLDTRKTLPGWRRLDKYATACGGAQNHRMGLYDAILIKDNHIAVAGGIEAAVRAARAGGGTDIQVECDSLDQIGQALDAGADRILLDNMTIDEMAAAVRSVKGRVPLEASGGVTLDTIRDIAETGVDYISVGAITQSAPAVDIGLDFRTEDR